MNRKRKAMLLGFLMKAAVGLVVTGPPASDLAPAFTPNLGQSDPRVLYLSAAKDSNYFLTTWGATLTTRVECGPPAELRVRLVKPSFLTRVTQEELSPAMVTYGEVYPGVDLCWQTLKDKLKMEFRVRHGDPARIKMEFEGTNLRVNEAGELTAGTGGAWKMPPPAVVIRTRFGVEKVAGRFIPLKQNKVGFRVGPA